MGLYRFIFILLLGWMSMKATHYQFIVRFTKWHRFILVYIHSSAWLDEYEDHHPELSGSITTLTVVIHGGCKFYAAMDTLIDQDGGCKLLCSNGHLDRSRWKAICYQFIVRFTKMTQALSIMKPQYYVYGYCSFLKVKFLFIAISGIFLGIFKGTRGNSRAVPEPMCLPTMTQAGREHCIWKKQHQLIRTSG